MNRRQFLTTTAFAGAAAIAPAAPATGKRLGLTAWSYNIRWKMRNERQCAAAGLAKRARPVGSLSGTRRRLPANGVGDWTKDFAGQVRDKRESLGIALEGQIGLPKKPGDLSRFENELLAGKEAGAQILRTTCLSGRRYENFDSMAAWKTFARESREALERVEPVLAKHRVKLAVENHKDWRIDEFLDLLRHLDSEWIGVNFDFGNNLSLLEHPIAVAEALAPYIMTTHFKDMALAEYEDGFLLSEVPLGGGVLDLRRVMDVCEASNPEVQFNLEMITRDPLPVPVWKDNYWITMPQVPATDLASTRNLAAGKRPGDMPHISGRSEQEQIDFEEENVRRSFAYAPEESWIGIIMKPSSHGAPFPAPASRGNFPHLRDVDRDSG